MKNIYKKILITLFSMICISCGHLSSGPDVLSSSSNTSVDRDDDEVWVEKIEVTKQPDKLVYVPNEEMFDSRGMILKATWNDGYVEENVNSTKYYVEPSGVLPVGTTYVTIFYGDASTKLDISTSGKYELYIIQNPVKTDYTVGEFFDPTGLILGYKAGNTTRPIEAYDINKVSFDKKPLTKQDTFVTVSYEDLTIDINIKVLSPSLKIELEDKTFVTMTNCKPKNQVVLNDDGTYSYGKESTKYANYEDAYAKHTESARCQMENASNRDFLSDVNTIESTFTVTVTPTFAKANLRIRGASNAVGNYDKKSKPTQSSDMDLTRIMNVEVNGQKITIDSGAIFEGIVSAEPSHYVWTNWHTAFINTIELNANEVNTIKFTFNPTSDYVHPWGNALGQYDYLLLEEV